MTFGSDEWPGATEERRREIWELHRDYTQGLMWFLQHDEALPLQAMPSNQMLQRLSALLCDCLHSCGSKR